MKKTLHPNNSYYEEESRKWLATLHDLKIENIRLKNQLSQTISGPVAPDFLEQAERFQQHFVEKDQLIDLLRHEINTLLPRLSAPDQPADSYERQCIILAKDIDRLIHEFDQMKQAFTALHPAGER